MIIVGIDPGITGAIGAYDISSGSGAVWDIPTLTLTGKSKVKRIVDPRALADIFDAIVARDREVEFVMEAVNSMPGQGVATVFSLGDSYGCLRGVVGAMGYECFRVAPQRWKLAMQLSSDKEDSLHHARELFPGLAQEELSRKKDHNRAESLLLAVWRAQELGGM